MTVSDQLVAVFNALAEKFGVVIDWSSANVIPYIQDVAGRIIRYEIATSIAWLCICFLIAAGIFWLVRWLRKMKRREKEHGDTSMMADEWNLLAVLVTIASLILVVPVAVQAFDIIRACTIPEATIIGFIKGLGGCA